jgi:hypothetical protein
MAQMAAAGGADAPFGVSCTPAARPCQTRQRFLGELFVIYHEFFMLILIEEKVAKVPIFSPPRENGGGCTPSA